MFLSSSSYKPQAQIRQEGFHPAHPHDAAPGFDPFGPFVPDPFRKFPAPAMDFGDELVSLMSHDRPADDRYPARPPHNIFDVSAPAPPDPYPPHFNQTLPALNSSLRYENELHFARHSPSPPHPDRSRSRSRPPSGAGPARTARPRRNNSVGGASPPPGRPHAIVIPRSRAATVGGTGNAGWYMPGHSASEFSLPTPDSLTSHHSHSSPPQNPYSPFSLSSPTDSLHLPPVSALHSLQQSYLHHGSPHDRQSAPAPSPAADPAPKPPSAADKQAMLANEKRRRRRESHNAVERRRRDNINEKISELATLIPECMLDVASAAPAANPVPRTASPAADDPASPLDWKKEPGDAHSGSGTPPPPSAAAASASATAGPDGVGIVKANKGMILRKSVEYIRYLQQLVEAQGARNRELEAELKVWRGGATPAPGAHAAEGQQEGHAMDLAWNAGAAYAPNGAFFGLPSMPEGGEEGADDDEGEGEGSGMDVEAEAERNAERGRTRGVSAVGNKKGRKKSGGAAVAAAAAANGMGVVKEEAGHAEEMMVL
ncbi:hypothetical protein C0993_001047 [Termitomyces sp. T159_Od127]|nr:hypothetical protein C0993_001047 [Termitomyces sp. T159_Od127]